MEAKDKIENKTSYKLFILMAMSTAILLVSPVLLLGGLGYLADKIFHTAPLYLIIGGILGFISGIVNVFRMMQMMQKKKLKVQNEKLEATKQN